MYRIHVTIEEPIEREREVSDDRYSTKKVKVTEQIITLDLSVKASSRNGALKKAISLLQLEQGASQVADAEVFS